MAALDQALGREGNLPSLLREPGSALELVDRYLLRTLNLGALGTGGAPRRIAVVIEFAEFVVPRGDALQLGGGFAANTVKVLGWANDPAITQANIVTVLISEGLRDMNDLVVDNPHAASLHIPLPDEAEMTQYVQALATSQFPELPARTEVPFETRQGAVEPLRSMPSSVMDDPSLFPSAWWPLPPLAALSSTSFMVTVLRSRNTASIALRTSA